MKNIFRSLGVLTLLLALVGHAFAVDVYLKSGAKVRYAIEKKSLTQAQANALLVSNGGDGYVDLWAYALYNKGYWEQVSMTSGGALTRDLIRLSSNGKVNYWAINFTLSTHSYFICDKSGTYTPSGNFTFAGPFMTSTCGSGHEQEGARGVVGPSFVNNCCPSYAYSASGGETTFGSLNGESDCDRYVDIWTDENGVEWYRLKLYQIRYEYPTVGSFYTRFYCGASVTSDAVSNGASTFQASYNGTTTPIFGIDNWHTSDADWSHYQRTTPYNPDLYNFVIGGVEVIADPEFILTAGATCGGSDLQGSFKVNNWNGKSWSDYTKVKMYVNTAGGTRKDITAQTAVTPSLPLNTSSTAVDFNYSLSSSAYMMNGAPADSLIWAFEEEKMMFI